MGYCELCDQNDIKEFHLILDCQFYLDLRTTHIKELYYAKPSVLLIDYTIRKFRDTFSSAMEEFFVPMHSHCNWLVQGSNPK